MTEREKAARDRDRRRAIVAFLNKQLRWLEKNCLEFSALAATGDVWAQGQYRYFRDYRKNVRHLVTMAKTGKQERRIEPRDRKG